MIIKALGFFCTVATNAVAYFSGQKFALMEEKVVLANLFRNFRVEAVTKREDVTIMMEIITRPKEDIKVKLIPR